ncbi:MAG: LppM family (lipo)protein [Nitriliruptoraceae bacterium]
MLTGCRLDVAAGLEVDADGGGRAMLDLVLDGELVAELDALEVDPTAELEATISDTDWSLTRERGDQGALELRLVHEVDDAAELGEVLGELDEGLAPADPALRLDLDVATDPDGRVEVDGTATFEPPSRPAATVDGEPVGPDRAALAELVAETVTASLTATLPGEVLEHDGGQLDGRSVTWELDVGEEVAVRAVAAPAPWWRGLGSVLWPAALFGALAALVSLLLRRRRRRRSEEL